MVVVVVINILVVVPSAKFVVLFEYDLVVGGRDISEVLHGNNSNGPWQTLPEYQDCISLHSQTAIPASLLYWH